MDINSLLSPSDDCPVPTPHSPASARTRSRPAFVATPPPPPTPTPTPTPAPTAPAPGLRQSPRRSSTGYPKTPYTASSAPINGWSRLRDEAVMADGVPGATKSEETFAVEDDTDPADAVPLTEQDYARIRDLLLSLADRPYQYEHHVEYVSLLRHGFLVHQANREESGPYALMEDLRKARKDMLDRFPLSETMWVEWIADEIAVSTTFEQVLHVVGLCAKAVEEECASVKLWKTYAGYIEFQYNACRKSRKKNKVGGIRTSGWENVIMKSCFRLELVTETYRLGAMATEGNIAQSHILWNKYRDFFIAELSSKPSRIQRDFVHNLYLARLQMPHAEIISTYTAFSQFATKYYCLNYESIMGEVGRQFSSTTARSLERTKYEIRLAEHGIISLTDEWNIWAEYLEWETSRSKQKLEIDMACGLYERCLMRFGEQAKVWEEYVFFVLEKAPGPRVTSLLKRATRHCPWSGTLWAQYIIALERAFRPFEEVSDVKHRATTTGMLDLGGLEEVLKVNIAWCGYLKRRAFEHDAGEEEFDMAEMGIAEAVTETGKKDPQYRLQRIHINFCTLAEKLDAARCIWKDLAKVHGNSYEFWMRYYQWELARGPDGRNHVGAVLRTALSKQTLDWPEKVLETWKNHVEDFGTIEEIEFAHVRYRKFVKEILERRTREAQAAAWQQEQAGQHPEVEIPQGGELAKANSKRRRSIAEADDSQPTKKLKASEDMYLAAKRDRENTTIIVKNLPPNYPAVKVRQFFRDCGTINSLNVILEKDELSSTATVEFESKEDVLAAQTKDMKTIDGHSIEVQIGTGSTLYVTNFPPTADESYIRDLFNDCGEIVDIRFPSLKYNTHRRFCYVQFASSDQAERATSLHGRQLGGKENLVAMISSPGQKSERSGAVYEGREVYIRNIDFHLNEVDIRKLFETYGEIEKARLPPGPKKGTHKGFGFVTFSTKEEAIIAVDCANGKELGRRTLIVSIAEPNPTKQKPVMARESAPSGSTKSNRHVGSPAASVGSPAPPSGPSFDAIRKKTLGVMNVADTVNDTKIRQMFEKYGPLRKVTLRPDHQGAIVEYETVADAGRATLAIDGTELAGRRITIGSLPDLMRQAPEVKQTKGFASKKDEKKTFFANPRAMSRPGTAVGGQRRRTGLGFSGSIQRQKGTGDETSKPGDDIVMMDGLSDREAPKAKSNADFRAMLLHHQ